MRQSQADQINRGRKLLRTVRENEAELSGVTPFRVALEKVQTRAESSRKRREELLAATREATRQLNKDLAEVQDAAISLRSFVKSVLGYRNPKLVHYGIRPIGKRRRRSR